MGQYWICKKFFATGKVQMSAWYQSGTNCIASRMNFYVTVSVSKGVVPRRIRCDLSPHSLSKETDVQILGE